MNDRVTNRLNMAGASIGAAELPEHRLVWTGHAPAAFGTELAAIKTSLASVLALASQASSVTTGTAEQKDVAETALEDNAFPLARSLALHFKKTNKLDLRAKVDLPLSALQGMRAQNLVAKAKEIRDLATAAEGEPGSEDRGVTDTRIMNLTAAINVYEPLIGAPRIQAANRTALLRELETRSAELVESLRDLDDLVVQFDRTEPGRRFITAWQQARITLDAGHGPTAPPPPPPPPPPAP